MNRPALRRASYVPVDTPVAAAGLAESIAREQGARLVTGWGAALDVLDQPDPGAELVAIADEGRRAGVHGSTAARAVVELRRQAVAAGWARAAGERGPGGGAVPAETGSATDQLWATRDRLRGLQHRTADVVRIARGMAIAAAGAALILAGTNTVSVPVAVAIGVACMLVVMVWWASSRHRAVAARRSLNEQLVALGVDDRDHLAWLDEWTASWDATFGAVMAHRDDEVEMTASARRASHAAALLATIQELEAAGITAANALERARREWDDAVSRAGLEPVPMHLVGQAVEALPTATLDPVVVAGRSIDDPAAEELRQVLRRPARRAVWVVAPGVDAWAETESGSPS